MEFYDAVNPIFLQADTSGNSLGSQTNTDKIKRLNKIQDELCMRQ